MATYPLEIHADTDLVCGEEPSEHKVKYIRADEVIRLQKEIIHLKKLLSIACCPNCDGSGGIPVQVSSRQLVTREMAMDACCPEMEGSLYSDDTWEQEQCRWCDERNQLLNEKV